MTPQDTRDNGFAVTVTVVLFGLLYLMMQGFAMVLL